jgi:hypothetical protein
VRDEPSVSGPAKCTLRRTARKVPWILFDRDEVYWARRSGPVTVRRVADLPTAVTSGSQKTDAS